MSKTRLAIVGCGGMGHRHLFGLGELHRAGWERFELVGACDPVLANAESLADEAEELLGSRPTVVENLDELAKVGIDAVDVTTTPRHHHTVAVETRGRGWHSMVEKPVGLTVRACHLIREAAEKTNVVMCVAENYRRDPMNRLARALLEKGAIGDPRFLIHQTMGGGDKMMISVWRHQKDQSGVLLDVGVHFTDMMEYLLGEIDSVYAQTRLYEFVRHNPAAGGGEARSNPAGVYGKWQREMPAEFRATAEDTACATLGFKSGVMGQYLEDHASHGQGGFLRQIHGSQGSMTLPRDRSGDPITLHLEDQGVVQGDDVLDLVPDFCLDQATTALFGGERLGSYSFEFSEIDRKVIATEYADFAGAIAGDGSAEVDVPQGTRSVAVSYAILESGLAGRLVTVDEILSESVDAYQRDINEGMGI